MEWNMNREKELNERKAWMIFTGCVTLAGVAIGIGLGVYSHRQLKKATRIMSKAVDSVTDMTVVDVRDEVVHQAIRNATNHKVEAVVNRVYQTMRDDISAETHKRVCNAVQQSQGKIQKAVTDAIAKEAAKIDQSDILEEATEKAKELLVEKFDGKLDGLLSDYQRNLDNVGKIYQSIASSMTNKQDKNVTLNLG